MIAYFSGTGNCKYVAERIAAALDETAASIETCNSEIALAPGECFGFITPTHWLELPVIVRAFLSKLVLRADDTPYVFVVATYGTTPGCCGKDAQRLLKRNGIVMDAAYSIKMPDTWTPIFDLSDPEEVAKQNADAEKKLDAVIDMIRRRETGNHMEKKKPYFIRLFTDPLLNRERRTKHFHLENTCVGCGLCAKKCPVQAIELQEGRPVWVKPQCTLCLRCLHHCPVFAIQYGNGKTKEHGQYKNPNVTV